MGYLKAVNVNSAFDYAEGVWIYQNGQFVPIRGMWAATNAGLTDPHTSHYVTFDGNQISFGAPTETVPGVSIGSGPELTGQTEYSVSWTTVGTSDPAYSYDVRVRWYVNGTLVASQQVHQGNGIVKHTANQEDDVYGVVNYVNEIGHGPTTQTVTR